MWPSPGEEGTTTTMESNLVGVGDTAVADSSTEVDKTRGSLEGDNDLSKVLDAGNPNNGPDNPLLVDLILDKIFRLIISPIQKTSNDDPRIKFPAKDKKMIAAVSRDVQNFRLVCKLWRDRATSIFKEFRAPLIFLTNEVEGALEYIIRIRFGEGNEWERRQRPNSEMRRFLNTMKDSTMIPSESYVLRTPIFKTDIIALVNEFFKICGPEMVNLKMNCGFLSGTVHIKERESGILDLPKLKSLCICARYFDTPRINTKTCTNIGSLIGLILKSAPNLQQFKLEYSKLILDYKDEKEEEEKSTTLLSCIQGSLTRLAVDIPQFTDEYLEAAIEKKMKLEICKLNADFVEMSCSEDLVRKFFEMQSKSLKVLTWPASSSSLLSKGFPKMEELVSLTLNGESAVPIPFPKTFPKLKVLNLNSLSFEGAAELLSNTCSTPSVEELHLPQPTMSMELVKTVAKAFHAVKKLYATGGGSSSLPNNPNKLPEIFVYFSNIEELFITFHGSGREIEVDGDAIFSGIPHETCEQIRSNDNFDDANLSELQRNPSILQLTKLKKLILKGCSQVTFTDLTALIFLKMDSLEELHAERFKQMKKKSMEQLKEKLTVTGACARDYNIADFDFRFINLENEEDSDSEWETDLSFDEEETDYEHEGSDEEGIEDEGNDEEGIEDEWSEEETNEHDGSDEERIEVEGGDEEGSQHDEEI